MPHEQKLSAPPRDTLVAYYPAPDRSREEEIRLVDLWLVLVRRRVVFFTVAALILTAGIAHALLAPPQYRYSALIELGSVSSADGAKSVEGVSTALAKINAAFLPAVLADYLKTQPEGTELPEIKASVPKNSETLMLAAEGTAEEGATLMALQTSVVTRLADNHAALVNAQRRSIRINITAAKDNLKTLANKAKSLDNQAKRIEELAVTLTEQRSEIARQLDAAIALEQSLRGGIDTMPSDVASRLQANVEARALRDQLMQLDERVTVDLPESLDEIRIAADGNAREILAQQARIADLESSLADIRDTRAIQPPTRSLEPSGLGGMVVIMLAAGLGVFLGTAFAFLAEGLARARALLAESGDAQARGPSLERKI